MNRIALIHADRCPDFDDLDDFGLSISRDWAGNEIPSPPKILFWLDQKKLHFIAGRRGDPPQSHPESRPHCYQADLWRYDVAEFFLSTPDRETYLEFNLAPNGAWWSCAFGAPRQPLPGEPSIIPEVTTRAFHSDRYWAVVASIPIDWMEEHYQFGPESSLNATLILNSPRQIFLTAAPLSSSEPDFHRPHEFLPVEFTSLSRDFPKAAR